MNTNSPRPESLKPGDVSEQAGQAATSDTTTSEITANSLRIRCPYCHNTSNLDERDDIVEIVCSSCGGCFSLAGGGADATQTVEGGNPPRRIGHFELVKQIGFGSYGTVWQARDTKLDRSVAIKVPRKIAVDQGAAEKFLREARAGAQLSHPNIVSIHEVGVEGQLIYIVQDLVQGVTLHDYLTARELTFEESIRLCSKIAEALDYAHKHGVVHRDLKPGNIMLNESGEPFLMDFGLAKRDVGEITVTVDGQLLGTPAFMSPEQATGKSHRADRRSDIYSLGVILFRLLTGELPFRGNVNMVVKQVVEDAPPSPRRLNHRVPRDLETICLKCMEKTPANRYESAEEVVQEFQRVLNGEPIKARAVGAFGRMWRWYNRNPDASTQVAGVYTILCGLLLVAWAIEGLFVYGFGIDDSPDAASAMAEITGLLFAVYLPLLATGYFVIRGRLAALIAATLMFGTGLLLAGFGLAGKLQYSGVFNDARLRLGILLLLFNLLAAGVIVNATALLCRLTDCWQRRSE